MKICGFLFLSINDILIEQNEINMKKYLFITLLIVNFSNIYPQFGGGAGTEGNPYQISTAEHLAALATNVNAGTTYANTYFKLMNDINLSSYLSESGAGYNGGSFWLPIGNGTNHFYGHFDGDGKVISNLKINRASTDYIGLFGSIHSGFNGELKNLGVTIDAGRSYWPAECWRDDWR